MPENSKHKHSTHKHGWGKVAEPRTHAQPRHASTCLSAHALRQAEVSPNRQATVLQIDFVLYSEIIPKRDPRSALAMEKIAQFIPKRVPKSALAMQKVAQIVKRQQNFIVNYT